METDRKEIYRYLGYGVHPVDEETRRLVEICMEELERAEAHKAVMREFPLTVTEDGFLDGGCFRTKSRNLLKNLDGCDRVLVMAATLGAEVDRLLLRYGKLSVSRAVVMQAAASAMIEAWCNEVCAGWKQAYEARRLYLRPRFSPGYGDFSLSCQEQILNGLEAGKRLGITLTDGGLMMPTKSVTAVSGVSAHRELCPVEGCEACTKADCLYRRETV